VAIILADAAVTRPSPKIPKWSKYVEWDVKPHYNLQGDQYTGTRNTHAIPNSQPREYAQQKTNLIWYFYSGLNRKKTIAMSTRVPQWRPEKIAETWVFSVVSGMRTVTKQM